MKACPHTKSNPADCPLCELRRLDAGAIAQWLDGLRVDEKEYLMLYHQCCLVIQWEAAKAQRRKKAVNGGGVSRRRKRA